MPVRNITVIGSLNADLVTVTPRMPLGGETLTASTFSTQRGGKGANQAVACVRLSRPNPQNSRGANSPDFTVRMIGAVGSDSFGSDLISGLSGDGIDTTLISVVQKEATGVAVILVEENTGENRILLNPGANHSLKASSFEDVASLGTPKPDLIILQLEIPLDTVLSIIKLAKVAGISVLLNPAPAVELPDEVFDGLDHLVVNESEAAILSHLKLEEVELESMDWGAVTDAFLRKGVKNVIVTLGSKGAYFSNAAGKGGMASAAKVQKVVDTTAAGDTFVSAYAVHILDQVQGEDSGQVDLGKAVEWACKAAGRTVEKAGAQNSIPWSHEIEPR
ncbi:MAG: hypothetical protein M1818_001899 [Claussenomyces sp. TS43310]|nr:MAG: hypothetical protein M1818_001899 [Claussenomyces sp. TS43310]